MVLFIDACFGKNSRTRRLAEAYLSGLDEDVDRLCLHEMDIPILDEVEMEEREKAAKTDDRSNPFVRMAVQFEDATRIVIAAPFYNFSFPSVLLKYIEAVMVNRITYERDEDGVIRGNCEAKEIVFITTSGEYIYNPNHQLEHLKSLFSKVFGIRGFVYYYLEGLDYPDVNQETVISEKIDELKLFAMMNISFDSQKRSIMVVDDSKVNILKTEHILKEAGYNVISATSGPQCLKALKMNKADMFLLDIEMPGMNGFETLLAIREIPEYKDTPIVFVTSDNTMEIVIKASQYNASGYVTKPFTRDELMVHVEKAMHERNR